MEELQVQSVVPIHRYRIILKDDRVFLVDLVPMRSEGKVLGYKAAIDNRLTPYTEPWANKQAALNALARYLNQVGI